MRELAARGWVCFNVDYRLSPLATFPDHLVDVKRAIAWVRDHADEYGIDPDFIAVSGGSAGGHLSTLAALTANRREYQPGFESADTSVQAAVPFYGVYDLTNRNGAWPAETIPDFIAPIVMKADPTEAPEAYAAASPLDQVHEAAPPFFVIHGQLDILAPVEDARDFVARLRAVSAEPVYYLELRGAQHAFETFASIRANAVVDAAVRFLGAVWTAHQVGATTTAELDRTLGTTLGTDAERGARLSDAARVDQASSAAARDDSIAPTEPPTTRGPVVRSSTPESRASSSWRNTAASESSPSSRDSDRSDTARRRSSVAMSSSSRRIRSPWIAAILACIIMNSSCSRRRRARPNIFCPPPTSTP